MKDLDELIRYENESTRLDFKTIQYTKPSYEALLKDLMAMANANISGDRYIVIGVKHRPDGTRELAGIVEGEFVDSAIYHQLARENIEPEIHFDYQPYRFQDVLLGILRIHDCTNPPYMMRKQFGQGLRAGDAYIRKGSHQARVTRPDIDRMLRNRIESGFSGTLRIGFDAPGTPEKISRPAVETIELPSQAAAKKIRAILKERQEAACDPTLAGFGHLVIGAGSLGAAFGATPYAQRSDKELRENLQNVQETYAKDDLYVVFEKNATRINLTLINEGTSYIEDASIRVVIPKREGLLVADQVHHKPVNYNPLTGYMPTPYLDRLHYPSVVHHNEYVEVTAEIGNLRHGIPTSAFQEPLRLVLGKPLIGAKISFECTVFGKQLREPRTKTLSILVASP